MPGPVYDDAIALAVLNKNGSQTGYKPYKTLDRDAANFLDQWLGLHAVLRWDHQKFKWLVGNKSGLAAWQLAGLIDSSVFVNT